MTTFRNEPTNRPISPAREIVKGSIEEYSECMALVRTHRWGGRGGPSHNGSSQRGSVRESGWARVVGGASVGIGGRGGRPQPLRHGSTTMEHIGMQRHRP